LTAEPEVVDIVINLVFQRLSSSDGSSLLRKKRKQKQRQFSSKKQSRVANLLSTKTTRNIVLFGKLDHMCKM